MTARAFPPPPTKFTNEDGTLTPYATRFLRDMFAQLGGTQPVDLSDISNAVKRMEQIDRTLFFVMALP